MNVSPRFLVLAALVVTAGSAGVLVTACSSGGGNPADGGTDAAKDVVVKKEAGPTPEAGTDDGGSQGPTVDPQCTVPSIGTGACNPALDDAGISCNAITNAGCDAGAGEACDFDQNGGLSCFPAPNDQAVCATCDNANGPFCQASEHCVPTATGSSCARMCCTDSDCTPGHCDTQTLGFAPLGVCVK